MTDADKALKYIKELYQNGATQAELAQRFGISQPHINRLLCGQTTLDRAKMSTIINILAQMPESALADPMPRTPLVPETQTRAVSLDIILDAIMTSDLDSDTKVKVYGIIKTLYKDQQI